MYSAAWSFVAGSPLPHKRSDLVRRHRLRPCRSGCRTMRAIQPATVEAVPEGLRPHFWHCREMIRPSVRTATRPSRATIASLSCVRCRPALACIMRTGRPRHANGFPRGRSACAQHVASPVPDHMTGIGHQRSEEMYYALYVLFVTDTNAPAFTHLFADERADKKLRTNRRFGEFYSSFCRPFVNAITYITS